MEKDYKEPVLIKFDAPVKIKLSELHNFLDKYKPYYCADAYAYQRFEYGDEGNWINAIVMDMFVAPRFCKYYEKDQGIFSADTTQFCVATLFWKYDVGYPFWQYCPTTCYDNSYQSYKNIDDVMVNIDGVYIISWKDKINYKENK